MPHPGTNFLTGDVRGLEDDLAMLDVEDAARTHEALSPEEHAAALRAVRQLHEAPLPPGTQPPSVEPTELWSKRWVPARESILLYQHVLPYFGLRSILAILSTRPQWRGMLAASES